MFVLMTVYWILSVVFELIQIDGWTNMVTACYGSDNALLCFGNEIEDNAYPMSKSMSGLGVSRDIVLASYIIADGVLVWRAWVLCSDQSRAVLMFPVVTLGVNTRAFSSSS
jgi:hypothetical protein